MRERIVVFPFPLLSHVLRCASLLRGLQAQYEIIFAGNTAVFERVKELGFATLSCLQFDPEKVLECARKFDFSWIDKNVLEEVFLDQVRVLRELSPSLVISDAAQTVRMASEYTGIPHLSIVNGYMTQYYAGYRGIPEGHPAYQFESKAPPSLFRMMVRTIEKVVMKKVHAPFRELRAYYRLPFTRTYLDEFEGDLIAIVDDEKIFPQHTLPVKYVPLGPAFHFSSSGEGKGGILSKEKPIVLLTMGSSGEWKGATLLNDPLFNCFTFISIGKRQESLAGITHYDFLEPESLYPHIAAVICHGGNGSIYQALSYGIPVLCRPTMFEQEWNVAQFESFGWVTRIPPRVSARELYSLLEQSICNPLPAEITTRIQVKQSQERFNVLVEQYLNSNFSSPLPVYT